MQEDMVFMEKGVEVWEEGWCSYCEIVIQENDWTGRKVLDNSVMELAIQRRDITEVSLQYRVSYS